jgi:hypothetical protein
MPEQLTIHLPIATERVLRYTLEDREELEKRFRHFGLPGLREIIFERITPVRPNPLRDGRLEFTGGGDLEAQRVLIWVGIRHNNPKRITEEAVKDWLRLAVQEEGRSMFELVTRAVHAVGRSGILGFTFAAEALEAEPEEDAPKEEPTASAS